MKQYLCLILVVVLLLAGCGNKNAQIAPTVPVETHPEKPTEIVEAMPTTKPLPQYSQVPMIAVSMPIQTETAIAEALVIVFMFESQTLQLVNDNPEVADRIILNHLNRLEKNHKAAATVSSLAEGTYREGSSWTSYFYEAAYFPTRIDNAVLSIFNKNVQYTGGNHPQTECTAANYNMQTGEVLTLGSILTNIAAKDALNTALVQSASMIAEDMQLYEEYPQIIYDRLDRDETYDEDWFFSTTGLCFFFAPYEIAPYISGSVVIEIPYDQLDGIIHHSFLPENIENGEGNIFIQNATEINFESFSQIAEVSMEKDGHSTFIYTDGLIQDVEISVENVGTIFRTLTLSPGDGILLTADFLEGYRYSISYRSGAEMITCVLSFDKTSQTFSFV